MSGEPHNSNTIVECKVQIHHETLLLLGSSRAWGHSNKLTQVRRVVRWGIFVWKTCGSLREIWASRQLEPATGGKDGEKTRHQPTKRWKQ